jgi:hypothetical protein
VTRTCAFCGKDEVTKEHLFAKWVRDVYSDTAVERSAIEFASDESIVWCYQGYTLDQNVKAFCAKCNNEWMSQLEVRAASVMRPMIRAEQVPVKMGYVAQGTVASWATKTAFVLHQLYPAEYRVPIAYYRDFHKKQEPSSDVLVMLGARHIAADGKGRANLFEYKAQFVGTGSNGFQHIHFAVGAIYLGVVIKIDSMRKMSELRLSDEIAKRLHLIWPISSPEVVWPLGSISDVGGVDGVFEALTSAIGGSPPHPAL